MRVAFCLLIICALLTGSASTALPPLPLSSVHQSVNCETDGKEGKRVLAVYLYPPGQPNNFTSYADDIRMTLHKIDEVWDAAADPYDQHVRWSCYADTSFPRIRSFRGPAIGTDGALTFSEVVQAMSRAGLNSANRVYLIFADHVQGAYPNGGQATMDHDDSPYQSNRNNTGPAYAMIDGAAKGWSWGAMWYGAMHELGHTLGAVQCSAPHSSCPAGETTHHHCWDEYDVMCYDDGGSYFDGRDGVEGSADDRDVTLRCDASSPGAEQWDCGKDDYFNIRPTAGTYLATHWNLARSSFVTPRRTE